MRQKKGKHGFGTDVENVCSRRLHTGCSKQGLKLFLLALVFVMTLAVALNNVSAVNTWTTDDTNADITIGNNNEIFIDNSANYVGIGTTSPGETLAIVGNLSASTGFRINGAATGPLNLGNYILTNAGITGGNLNGTLLNSNTISELFSNVTGRVTSAATANYIPKMSSATALANSVMYETSSNIGIGTTSPTVKLEVAGALRVNGAAPTNLASAGGIDFSSGYTRIISWGADASTKGGIKFVSASSDASLNTIPMVIDTAGNVGIGTTTVTGILQVAQPTTGTGTVTVTATGTTVTGSGTKFTNTFEVGDTITANSEIHTISAIASDTSMTTDAWTSDASGVAYTLTGGKRFTVLGNGNVGIGTTTIGSPLTISGATEIIGSPKYYRNLASFTAGSGQVGTLKITMPKTWSNTMMSVKIQGYEYTSGKGPWEVIVGGYNYITTPAWINTAVWITGSPPFTSVRLAHDGTYNVILLGVTTTTWSYPKVVVAEMIAGQSNMDGWGSGWSMSLITDESAISYINTPTIKMFTDSTGYVGIGGTSPSAKLQVNGNLNMANNSISAVTNLNGNTVSELFTNATLALLRTGGTMTGTINMGGKLITGGITGANANVTLLGGNTLTELYSNLTTAYTKATGLGLTDLANLTNKQTFTAMNTFSGGLVSSGNFNISGSLFNTNTLSEMWTNITTARTHANTVVTELGNLSLKQSWTAMNTFSGGLVSSGNFNISGSLFNTNTLSEMWTNITTARTHANTVVTELGNLTNKQTWTKGNTFSDWISVNNINVTGQVDTGLSMGNFVISNLATPTASSDAATKGYVDTYGGKPQWAGYTGTYTGNLGSLAGAASKCNTAYSGSHWCTYDEIQRLGTSYPYTSTVWINGVYVGSSWKGTANEYFQFLLSGQQNGCGSDQYGSTEATCADWLVSSGTCDYGATMNTVGTLVYATCDNTYYLACCK